MIIKNARVFREDGFVDGGIAIQGDRIVDVSDGEVLDAQGCYAIPGLIDLHFHGCVGGDFSHSALEEMAKMARYQAAAGVTAICPATMTLPEATLAEACGRMARFQDAQGAELVGINLEGPFVSPNRLGAQNPAYVRAPDADMVRRLQQAARGKVKLLAVAPEEEGALELIAQVGGEIACSVAHTAAGYDTALAAFRAGARQVTHLYNAMPPLHHRDPGVIGAALDSDCMVELICDGVHIHPAVVRATFRMFGEDRVILISDSMMATGLADGSYELGGLAVTVTGNTARLTEGGSIAGSVTNLMDCVRTAVQKMEIPLHTAVRGASTNPAQALGLTDRGGLEPGKIADLVLLRPDLTLSAVILRGKRLI